MCLMLPRSSTPRQMPLPVRWFTCALSVTLQIRDEPPHPPVRRGSRRSICVISGPKN